MCEVIDFATAWRKLDGRSRPLADTDADEIEVAVRGRPVRWRWHCTQAPTAPRGASHWRRIAN